MAETRSSASLPVQLHVSQAPLIINRHQHRHQAEATASTGTTEHLGLGASISLDPAVMLGELVQLHPLLPPRSPARENPKRGLRNKRLLQAASSPAASSPGGSGTPLDIPTSRGVTYLLAARRRLRGSCPLPGSCSSSTWLQRGG